MTTYAAYSEGVIYGIGESADDAIEDACLNIDAEDAARFRETCKTAPMSAALVSELAERGGAIAYLMVDGTLDVHRDANS